MSSANIDGCGCRLDERESVAPIPSRRRRYWRRSAPPTLARCWPLLLGGSDHPRQRGHQDVGGALLAIRSACREVDNREPDGNRMEEPPAFVTLRRIADPIEEQSSMGDDAVCEFPEHLAEAGFLVASLSKRQEHARVLMSGDQVRKSARGIVDGREPGERRINED